MVRTSAILTAAALTAAAVLAGAGAAGADPTTPDPSPAPTPSTSAAPSAAPALSLAPTTAPTTPPATPQTAIDHNGTYTVGSDIVAGTYASAGPVEGDRCYWRRIGGPDGASTLDNALSGKPQVVQIEPTDTAFKTNGCQPWQLTDAPPPGQNPPWLSGLQLKHYIDVINGLAGASGNGQLPPS
ncbi:hypothetical protein OG976_00390 [Mycobacterium sp. NBC_00419]|uniref:hypothetical protein n=1 Tax=Mycobacterium sp. NBC_00419 TaxID=2975989 RepID=UPI002E1BBEF3